MRLSGPIIGITTPTGYFTENLSLGEYSAALAIAAALAASTDGPFQVRYLSPDQPDEPFDGLIIPGGGDIHPDHYGRADLLGQVRDPDHDYDAFEIRLCRKAVAARTPLLGICRGMQIVNVANGGQLVPELADKEAHTHEEAEKMPQLRSQLRHDLQVKGGSRVAHLLGTEETRVNSLHSGGVIDVAAPFEATSWSGETVESLERADCWQMAVQFHPEELYRMDARWLDLFSGFLEAARAPLATH